MNLSAGYPHSLIRNGIPYDYPKLLKNSKTDVLILGGGISGALVAYYLRHAGVDCMLADNRTFGLGSTCASTSLLQYEIDTPLSKLTELIGAHKAGRAYELSGKAIKDLAILTEEIGFADLRLCSSIYFAAAEKDTHFLKKEFGARKEAGFDVRWMEHSDLLKQYGLHAPAAIVSSLAAETDAYMLTHALHQYNIKTGMNVYDRTQITKIVHHKKGVELVTANGYKISAKKLVYATGYESVKYIGQKIVDLAVTYATISEQFDNDQAAWNDRPVFWSTGNPYLYMRSTGDKRVLVGGRDDHFTSAETSETLIRRKSALLQKDCIKHFPAVPFKREFSWSGVFGSTKDGLPYIGPYHKLPNSFFALGFGGNGITFSVLAAQIVRDLILSNANADASLFSFDR